MKIAVIWSRFGPYHLARLRGASAQAAKHGQVRVIGVEIARDDTDYEWKACLSTDGIERVTVFDDDNYNDLSAQQIGRAIKRVLDEIEPDAVAMNGWSVPEARSSIDWCRSRPNVQAVLMSETSEGDRPRWWLKEFMKRQIVAKCDSALVGGRQQTRYLQKLGFPADRIFVGYDVVDNSYFCDQCSKVRQNEHTLRSQFGLPEQYFFACTRLLERKNVDGLLLAYSEYRTRSTDKPWGLVVAGSGNQFTALRQLEKDLSLEGVIWAGFVQYEYLPIYYGLASAFIHPPKSEAWGLVVNEAAASSLPLLLSTAVGAADELLQRGTNGYCFEADSTSDMCGAMLDLAQASAGTNLTMGRHSQNIIRDWSPARFGEKLIAAAQCQ